jgi:hypothetical protein
VFTISSTTRGVPKSPEQSTFPELPPLPELEPPFDAPPLDVPPLDVPPPEVEPPFEGESLPPPEVDSPPHPPAHRTIATPEMNQRTSATLSTTHQG